MHKVTVIYFKNPTGVEVDEAFYPRAEIHISTHGVLVVRELDKGKAIAAFSAGTWHSAKAE